MKLTLLREAIEADFNGPPEPGSDTEIRIQEAERIITNALALLERVDTSCEADTDLRGLRDDINDFLDTFYPS